MDMDFIRDMVTITVMGSTEHMVGLNIINITLKISLSGNFVEKSGTV
jgi:hypothetical protein